MIFVARPESEPKTDLGRRLRDVRKACAVPDREAFAKILAVSKNSIAHYERGERTPDASVLEAYLDRFGVNLNWLISGHGPMFLDGAPPEPGGSSTDHGKPTVQSGIFKETSKLVHESHKAKGVTLPSDAHLAETVSRYNELVAAARNPADESELRALFPWLELRISQDLEEAQNAPGSGKRSG